MQSYFEAFKFQTKVVVLRGGSRLAWFLPIAQRARLIVDAPDATLVRNGAPVLALRPSAIVSREDRQYGRPMFEQVDPGFKFNARSIPTW